MMKPVIEANGLWKSFGSRIVLRDVSLSIDEGERVILRGANGSGKSTLLALLANVLVPDEGTITTREDVTIGFAPERPDLPEHLLVGEWLDIVASFKRLARAELSFGVDELRRKPTKTLSLGQKHRVSLAAAFMGSPSLLVLDEPTNALDAATRAAVLERLQSLTALVATHDADVAVGIGARVVEVRGGALTGKNEHGSMGLDGFDERAAERATERCDSPGGRPQID